MSCWRTAAWYHASSAQNADLFWALRGGGGNFGIVTSFLFRLHPVETVIAGPTLWPIEQAQQTMQWYRDFIASAPDDLNGFFTFLIVPPAAPFPEHLHLKNLCGVLWCYVGSAEQADTIFKPVRDFGPPLLHAVGPMPYPALQSAFDGSTRRACNGTGAPISSINSATMQLRCMQNSEAPFRHRIRPAPLPDRRRSPPRRQARDRVQLPRRQLGRGHRRGRPGRTKRRAYHRLDEVILGRAPPPFCRQRIREFSYGRRARAYQSDLSRQLFTAE